MTLNPITRKPAAAVVAAALLGFVALVLVTRHLPIEKPSPVKGFLATINPILRGDGVTDNTEALQLVVSGMPGRVWSCIHQDETTYVCSDPFPASTAAAPIGVLMFADTVKLNGWKASDGHITIVGAGH